MALRNPSIYLFYYFQDACYSEKQLCYTALLGSIIKNSSLLLTCHSCMSCIMLLGFTVHKYIAAVYINYFYSTSSLVQSPLSSPSSSCWFFFMNVAGFVANGDYTEDIFQGVHRITIICTESAFHPEGSPRTLWSLMVSTQQEILCSLHK